MTQWYAIRAAGGMTLILFSASVVLGLINRSRWTTERWPRFVIDRVHRNVSLLALVFLGLHIVLGVTDSFVKLPLTAAFLPFSHSYRPFWVGLGSVALDLLIAIAATSLLRARIGLRAWRWVHWLAYLSWPVAVTHGIGNGTDAAKPWMLGIDAVCITAVLGALALRWLTVPATGAPKLVRGL